MSVSANDMKINSCRICLDTNYSDGVSFDEGDSWLKMFEFCFGLILSPEDTPRKLCGICVNKLKEFYKFKCKSIKSDKLWKSMISDTSNVVSDKCSVSDELLIPIKEENLDIDVNDSYDNINYEFMESDFTMNEEKCDVKDNFLGELDEKHIEINNKNYSEKSVKKKNRDYQSYSCKCCKRIFRYEKSYKRHLMKKKCKPRLNAKLNLPKCKPLEFLCGLCDEKSLNDSDIKEHLKIHSTNNDLSCKLCDYVGRDFADMETHRYSHQNPSSISHYCCHMCDKKCKMIMALQYHYRSVHLNKIGGMCTVCNKVYNGYKSWRDHEKLHKSAKYICDYCGRRFLYRHAIKEHIMQNHGGYYGFVCDICGSKFKRNSNLKLHILQVHDNKKVTCTHCNRTFKNEKNLHIHMKKEAREKKYQCEVCFKRFFAISLLNSHMIWHTDERPYACERCGASYKVKSQLTIHKRSHTGDFPYKCTVANCTKAFACSNQLKVHLDVHSGVRRYKCQFCEKTFHNKSNVIAHCAKRHNVANVVVETSKKKESKGES